MRDKRKLDWQLSTCCIPHGPLHADPLSLVDTQEEVHLHECIADQHFKCWLEYELKMSDEGSQERIL